MLHFDSSIVSKRPYQNHLGIFLDGPLTFEEHLKVIITKVNKTKGLFQQLQKICLQWYKELYTKVNWDFGDIIYDEAYNETSHQRIYSILCLPSSIGSYLRILQRKPLTKIRIGIPPTSTLVREIHQFILSNSYQQKNSDYNTRNPNRITLFHTKHNFFTDSFNSFTVIEWNKLDLNVRSAASLSVFKMNLLKLTRASPNSSFNCYNCKGIKYLQDKALV